MSKRGTFSVGLSLLAGAALGLAGMYLLDPEVGKGRRRDIRKRANRSVGQASDALAATIGRLTDHVQSIASNVGDRLSSGAGYARHLVGDRLPHSMSDAMGGLHDRYGGYLDEGRAMLHRTLNRVGRMHSPSVDDLKRLRKPIARWLHRHAAGQPIDDASAWAREKAKYAGRRGSSIARQLKMNRVADTIDDYTPHDSHGGRKLAAEILGVAALGAAAIYLFDPKSGASRRKMIRDNVAQMLRQLPGSTPPPPRPKLKRAAASGTSRRTAKPRGHAQHRAAAR